VSEQRPDRPGQAPSDPEREPGVPHQPPPEKDEGGRAQESSEESFPSSDPPSTGGPGI